MAQHPQLAQAYALFDAGRGREGAMMIEQLARTGHPDALFALADLHWRGDHPVQQNLFSGRTVFELAARAGHPMAIRAVTNLMGSGMAGPRDWPGAVARLAEEARGDQRRALMLDLIRAMELTATGDPRRLPTGETLSEAPHVTLYRQALTRAECDYLILITEPTFEPSKVISNGKEIRDPIRTSDGSTLHWLIEDPVVHALNRRVAAMTGSHTAQGEALQVLRYAPGQQYRRHVDWIGDRNRRLYTALLYLNNDYEGGETEFHKVGLKVRGRAGDVLVFRNAGADGRLDPLTEHAGLPVTRGMKYLATRWIREERNPEFQD